MRRTVLLPAATALACLACVSTDEPQMDWEQREAFRHTTELGGCAAGDLDPERPGDELAVACASGEVFFIWAAGGGWRSELVFHTGGAAMHCAIGELDSAHPGAELCVTGISAGVESERGPSTAWIARRGADGWRVEEVFRDDGVLRAVAAGDMDPHHPGDELVLAGSSRLVHVLTLEDALWRVERLDVLPNDPVDVACDAGRALVACADGTLVACSRGESDWTIEALAHHKGALARVAAHEGTVLVAAVDGALELQQEGAIEVLYRTSDRLCGAAVAELYDAWPGTEYATAGHDGRVVVVHRGSSGWIATEVARDIAPLHHLARGRIGGESSALVTCGESGSLIVVRPAPLPLPPASDR